MFGAELVRECVEACCCKIISGEGIFASPAGLKGRGTAAVIELLEAIVESHAHAAIDTEVVVGFISDATTIAR